MKNIFLSLLFLSVLASCSKETSDENGGGVGNPPLGNNCRVAQVTGLDSLTGIGLYSIYTRFTSQGYADIVRVFDSTTNSLQFAAAFTYKGDTIRISPSEYFLADASKRVRSYTTVEDTGTGIDTVIIKYNYDGGGYLTSKDIYLGAIPIPIYRFTYSWQNGNLAGIVGGSAIPTIDVKLLTATLEYGASTAKNFIQFLPDGFETAPYIMALDLGKKSRNLPQKVSVTVYDDAGQPDQTFVTFYKDFIFSSDGYLLEWTVQGEEAGGTPIPTGRSRFSYYCP